jgi:flagellar motility protein MotE (MotC chaperone)
MIRFLRELRLLPIAVVASACLLALTAADILLDRGTSATSDSAVDEAEVTTVVHATPGRAPPGDSKRSWAQQMLNYPDAKGAPPERTEFARPPALPSLPPLTADRNNADIITGTVPESEKGEKAKGEAAGAPAKDGKAANAGKEAPEPPPPDGKVIAINGGPGPSAAERAILERLQERRQELDKRGRELDIREGLIAEAEKRVEGKLAQIKENEAALTTAAQKKDAAEAARFKGLVTMYENMKPRDAAKIFDRLEVGVLLEVASQINPRNMSEILAQMSPDRAERLTVELASRAQAKPKDAHADLPKIEGRPTGQ